MEFSLKDLKVSPLDQEIFGFLRRKNLILNKLIKSGNFDSDAAIKVRKIKGAKFYQVIAGVDVFEILQELAGESSYPQKPKLKIDCEVVNLTDDETVRFMLHEAVNTPAAYSQYSKVQLYFLSRLYSNFSGNPMLIQSLQNQAGFRGTIYHNLQTSVKFAVGELKIKYADKFADFLEKYKGDKIYEKLVELKLIEYALKQNEWIEFCDFFRGSMAISHFYSNVYKKPKTSKTTKVQEIEEEPENVFNSVKALLVKMKSLSDKLNELTVEDKHLLNKLYGKDLEHFVASVMLEKQARKTSKSAEKMSGVERSNDGNLFRD